MKPDSSVSIFPDYSRERLALTHTITDYTENPMAQLNFDASKVDPAQPFEAIPSDKYTVEITKSELKPIKTGGGSYLEIEYTVLEGEYKGRKVWDRLCLNHSNKKPYRLLVRISPRFVTPPEEKTDVIRLRTNQHQATTRTNSEKSHYVREEHITCKIYTKNPQLTVVELRSLLGEEYLFQLHKAIETVSTDE